MLRQSDSLVFNSENNQDFFLKKIYSHNQFHIIPNWYQIPKSFEFESQDSPFFEIVYSGNMNDRVDWGLIESVAEIAPDIHINLVGSAERASSAFDSLLTIENVIYFGPQTEQFVLSLLSRSNLAVMPHKHDHVSAYMNPLKLQMYTEVGIPTISMNVPGIDTDDDRIEVCNDRPTFLSQVRNCYMEWKNSGPASKRAYFEHPATEISDSAQKYLDVIDNLRTAKGQLTHE